MCLGSAVSLGVCIGGDFIERFLPKSPARTPVGDLKVSFAPTVISLFFCIVLCMCEGGESAVVEVVGLVVFLMLGGE